jgi:transposase
MSEATDARRLSPETQEALRRRAVAAVFSGKSRSEAAQLFGVSRQSVNAWCSKAKSADSKALTSRKRGAHKPRVLNLRQEKWIRHQIEDKHPEQLKLPFVLWTREAVQALIEKKYGLKVPLRTLSDYLKRWGMTPQKPIRIAYQRDSQAAKRWREQEYPAIVAQAKAEGGLIYWGDEMGLRSTHQAGRSFSPKGKTPAIHTTGNRFGVNMISAVSNLGKLYFSVFVGSFVVSVFLAFLKRLIKQNKVRKVFLIVDGHPVHKAKAVTDWVAQHSNQIQLYFLPGYSPDLNPDELLNQDVKQSVFKQKRPSNVQEMNTLLCNKLRQRQKQPARIKRYFQALCTAYAAA